MRALCSAISIRRHSPATLLSISGAARSGDRPRWRSGSVSHRGATAAGIHRIMNARMKDEVRRVTVQRGYDPRQFSLLPLGGAGPVHGCAIARDLGMANVVVRDTPGVLSAFGLLVADVEHDQMETFASRADAVDAAGILPRRLTRLIALGQRKMQADGVAPEQVEIRRQADMRYAGQSYELTIEIPSRSAIRLPAAVDGISSPPRQSFYGHANRAAPVEFVNLRTVHVHRPAATRKRMKASRQIGADPSQPAGKRRSISTMCGYRDTGLRPGSLGARRCVVGPGDHRAGRHHARDLPAPARQVRADAAS